MAQDDELVEVNRERIVKAKPPKPSVFEFGPTEELLAAIYDVIGALNTNFMSANTDKSHKPKSPKPWPRPETAAERLRRQQYYDDFLDIVATVSPHERARFNMN